MPESTMSPSQGQRIWPLLYDEKKEYERRKRGIVAVSAEMGGLVLNSNKTTAKKSRPRQIFYSRYDSLSTKNRKEILPNIFTLKDKWCILLYLCICVQCTCCWLCEVDTVWYLNIWTDVRRLFCDRQFFWWYVNVVLVLFCGSIRTAWTN